MTFFASCPCCSRLSHAALERALESYDSAKLLNSITQCRLCVKEAAPPENTKPKKAVKEKGGRKNRAAPDSANEATPKASSSETLVCLECGQGFCEAHASQHTQSSLNKRKAHVLGKHSVFLRHRVGADDDDPLQGFCFQCDIAVGPGCAEDDDYADAIDGIAINRAGYCIDAVDYFSPSAMVIRAALSSSNGPLSDAAPPSGKTNKKHRSKDLKRRSGGATDEERRERHSTDASRQAMLQGGFVGLANLGNTCYMNAVLQCLSHSPRIGKAIEGLPNCAGPLTLALQRTVKSLRDPSMVGTSLVPKGIFTQLCRQNSMFSEHAQQDAEEALLCLLNGAEDEHRVCGGSANSCPTNTVGGVQQNTILCHRCGSITVQNERFYCLSVSVNYATSISAALRQFFADETLSGDSAYVCEHCHAERYAAEQRRLAAERLARERNARLRCAEAPSLDEADLVATLDARSGDDLSDSSDEDDADASAGEDGREGDQEQVSHAAEPSPPIPAAANKMVLDGDATMFHTISQLGDVVIVHLKRFYINPSTYTLEKAQNYIRIDPVIDFDTVCAKTDNGAPSNNNKPQPRKYELTGLVVHSGTLSRGHYFCYVKSEANGQWYRCSDDTVSVSTAESALSSQCYLAFYARCEA